VPEHLGREVCPAGSVECGGDGAPTRVRGDASDAGCIEDCAKKATDVVGRQWRVIAAEEHQMLWLLLRHGDKAAPQHLGREGRDGDGAP
jgi:hypothetical protein